MCGPHHGMGDAISLTSRSGSVQATPTEAARDKAGNKPESSASKSPTLKNPGV